MAAKSLSLAAGLARKAKNRALVTEVTAIQQAARDQEKEAKEEAAITAKLAADPGNAEVSLEAGKFFCFKAGDWERGLPLLAKGSDTELARLAVAEMNAGKTVGAIMSLGDAWWDWSDQERGVGKTAGVDHAADLYGSIIAKVQGLDRARLEKRIAAAGSSGSARGKKIFLAEINPSAENGVAFGVSRDGTSNNIPYSCAGREWPKGIKMMPGGGSPASLTFQLPEKAKRLRGKAGVFLPQGARPENGPREPLEFEIVVDGQSAWKSPPLPRVNDTADFDVPLFGAQKLELRVSCKSGHSAWAAWLDPELSQ
jgi:hypothetical protein